MNNLKTLYANLNGKVPEIYYDVSTDTYLTDDGQELASSEFARTDNINYVKHKSSNQVYEVVPFD